MESAWQRTAELWESYRRWLSDTPQSVSDSWRLAGSTLGIDFTDLPPDLRGQIGPCEVHAGRFHLAEQYGRGSTEWFATASYPPGLSGFVIEGRTAVVSRLESGPVGLNDPILDELVTVQWVRIDGQNPDIDAITVYLSDTGRRAAIQGLFSSSPNATVIHMASRIGRVKTRGQGELVGVAELVTEVAEVGARFAAAAR